MLLMFSIFDDAAKAFIRPFFSPSRGIALRGFMDAVSDKSSDFARHPHDYTLFFVGSYDEATGVLTANHVPERMASAFDLLSVPAVESVPISQVNLNPA